MVLGFRGTLICEKCSTIFVAFLAVEGSCNVNMTHEA